MRDDSNQSIGFAKALKRVDDHIERLWVERTETLIDEDRLKATSGRIREFAQATG
jgi:hypothetical protein